RSFVQHAGVAPQRNRHVDLFLACAVFIACELDAKRKPGKRQRVLHPQAHFVLRTRLQSALEREISQGSSKDRAWLVCCDLYATKLSRGTRVSREPEGVPRDAAVADLQDFRERIIAAVESLASGHFRHCLHRPYRDRVSAR